MAVLAAATLLLGAASVFGEIAQGDLTVKLEPVATGLTSPLTVTHAGDGSGRLFVVDQIGLIRIVENGILLPTPFLDITGKTVSLNSAFDERGLLGLAFHPDYADNGRFFVRYSAPRAGDPSEPCNDPKGFNVGCHSAVLAEYAVSIDPNVADPTSEMILFSVDEPQFNHNAGALAFGPDGFLYVALGDGGGANDGLADDPPSHGPIGNGQNIDTLLGSLLRIDVDGGSPYSIPPDNPFVDTDGLDEIYAYGFRNPYTFSFDDGPGGDGSLYLADVGQDLFEEIDIVVKGGNYGWVIREGTHCFDPFDPGNPPDLCDDAGMIDPIAEYTHAEGGTAIVGGYVYRGSSSPSLKGTYFFGDFSADFGPTGRLYYLVSSGPHQGEIRELRIGRDATPLARVLKGFGEDEEGELYVLVSTDLGPTGGTGEVYRLVGMPFGDSDDDADVELDDYADFAACLSGPGVPFDADGLNTFDVSVGPGFDFIPADVTIEVGDTVHWDWDSGFHNVESGVGGVHDGNFRSGPATSDPNTTYDLTFDAAFLADNPMPDDVYPYYCIIHVALDMIGSATVEPDPCARFDADDDGDVDLDDFDLLQWSFTGSD
jgi:glucose/arabinose dehydrogenase/plastocyanin